MQTSYITSRTHLFSSINKWQEELNKIFSKIRLHGIDSRDVLNKVLDGLEFVQVGTQYLTTIPILAECLEITYETVYYDLRVNQNDNNITGYRPKILSNQDYSTIASPTRNKNRQGRHAGRFYIALNPDDCLWLSLRHGYQRDPNLFDELTAALNSMIEEQSVITYTAEQTTVVDVNTPVEKQLELALA
jgi:hypothetical protein